MGGVNIWRPKGADFVHPPLWVFMTPSLRDPKVSPSLLTILYGCSHHIGEDEYGKINLKKSSPDICRTGDV